MVLLKYLFLSILFLQLSSCAKLGWMYDQSIGQISLLNQGRDNNEVLRDSKVSIKHKEKIKKIIEYKRWFYSYWGTEETDIYNETTFLESEAVTYLVIASPYNEIKAKKECFPMFGCFPYLGFFNKKDASEHAKELEEDGYVTYMRPVYAYSTLGWFDDNILSSFFYYNDYDLAELIFHELFHTIFFPKNEVALNENLANYFGKALAEIYFNIDEKQKKKGELKRSNNQKLVQEVVQFVNELNSKYKSTPSIQKESAQKVLDNFLKDRYNPHFKKMCEDLGVKKCFPTAKKWNNASFAAFMTYEKKADQIGALRSKLKVSLKDFFIYIKERHDKFKKADTDLNLSEFIFK